jgi:hypothetical protein
MIQRFITDKNLETPSIAITTASAEVRFRNFYNLEPIFDGAVLEVSSTEHKRGAFYRHNERSSRRRL